MKVPLLIEPQPVQDVAGENDETRAPRPEGHMVRSDDYKPRNEKPNGYGGGKTAYLDEIRWVPVPEVATRVAQVETGELDFADDLNLDSYDRLRKNANARPIVSKPYYWLVAVMNKKEGPMTNQKLRQAWQAAIDIEPIMRQRFRAIEPTKPLGATSQPARTSSRMMSRLAAPKDRIHCRLLRHL